MAKLLIVMHLLESQNRYPNCISLTLDIPSLSQGTTHPLDLILNLSFGEQWQDLLQGRIEFRLRKGKITIKSENGQLSPIVPSAEADYLLTTTAENLIIADFRLNKTNLSGNSAAYSLKIAQFIPSSSQWRLIITWEISPMDIFLSDAEGLWKHDITPNKHAILERSIIKQLFSTWFTPYLSQIQVTSDKMVKEEFFQENPSETDNFSLSSDLKHLIEAIYQVKTDNFSELAQLAGLNLLKDLAGGNLLATSLCGVELSEANLCYTHFRGATLTDIDLSEAHLRYANFSGADLSGAYLGNADLKYADFYRGSLALANLIGSDLTEANLIETNLSQANLSGAIVTGAKFGNNVGLTSEDKTDLQQRGATFLEN